MRTATHPVICKLLPARSCFPLSRGSRQQLTFHGVMRATSQVVLRIKQRQQLTVHEVALAISQLVLHICQALQRLGQLLPLLFQLGVADRVRVLLLRAGQAQRA